ncbi:Dihydrodipicolinate synthetase family protein [Colletotrichum higginsianum IMI 349063]|uniref:Dihydrodipicolinate synthetase family protein n=1 Tax=Colletotrichum higginsianum (strain IMI 349063) TaxID=759273 RepID=A0A1B7YV33_COLHI|nr:Dihydrodipicolinate synthetase family protein [Colletotrichum higginsianum IMI 349063]OBR15794.1 Dihydrodipicolinate synthetase family protein [Colletotrichum higginsianum IMI 349063]
MTWHINPDPLVMCKNKQVAGAIAAPVGAWESRRDWSSTDQAHPGYFSHFPGYKVHVMDWSSQEKLLGSLAKCFMEGIASLENLVYNADAPWEVMAKRHGIEAPGTLLDTNEGIKIRKVTVILFVKFHNGANHDTCQSWGDAEWTCGGNSAAEIIDGARKTEFLSVTGVTYVRVYRRVTKH